MIRIISKIIILLSVIAIFGCNTKNLKEVIPPGPALSSEEQKSTWFGKVEAARAYKNDKNETVIEWYCHRYTILTDYDFEKSKKATQTVKVKDMGEVHFVSSLRSPNMKLEIANKLVDQVVNTQNYALFKGVDKIFKGKFGDKTADFISGKEGSLFSNLRVIYVE